MIILHFAATKIALIFLLFLGNIWKIGFSISKLQEAVQDLRVTVKSRVKETKEAILFQSEEETEDQAHNEGDDNFQCISNLYLIYLQRLQN